MRQGERENERISTSGSAKESVCVKAALVSQTTEENVASEKTKHLP